MPPEATIFTNLLTFAGDIDLVARSERNIIRIFRTIRDSAERVSLK